MDGWIEHDSIFQVMGLTPDKATDKQPKEMVIHVMHIQAC